MYRMRSATGTLGLRCLTCDADATLNVQELRDLPFTLLDSWEPGLIVDDLYEATTVCPCGAEWHLRLRLIDGMYSAFQWEVRGATVTNTPHLPDRQDLSKS